MQSMDVGLQDRAFADSVPKSRNGAMRERRLVGSGQKEFQEALDWLTWSYVSEGAAQRR
jgi:hypothetical protein